MKKALLVIDMQNKYVGENHTRWCCYDNELLINNINGKIEMYDSENVIYIVNVTKKNFINMFSPMKAYEGSKDFEIVDGLSVVNCNIIKKYKGDAFSNPHLDKMLKEQEIDELELVGVDGSGCVALTAFGAIEAGYKVSIFTKAVGTTFKKRANKLNMKLSEQGVAFE